MAAWGSRRGASPTSRLEDAEVEGKPSAPAPPNLPQAVRAIPTSLIEFLRLASASHQRFFVSARVLLAGNVVSGETGTMGLCIPIASRVARQVTDTYPSHAEHEPAHE